MPVVEHGSISPVRLPGRNLVSDQISKNFARVDRFTTPNLRGQMLPAFSSADKMPYPFAVTVIPLFRRPDGRGCLYRSAVFVSKPITPHKLSVSFGSSVPCGGYNGGMAAPSSFDTAAFAVLTAANSQIFVGRSRRTAAPFPVPAWHTHKQLPRNIAKPSQWRHMALCVHFQFLLLLINGFHLCNTRKWERNQLKRKSSGWFIQPELRKIGIHLFHLFRLNQVRAVRCRWVLCFPGKPEEQPVPRSRSRLQQMFPQAAKRRAYPQA